MPEHFTCRNCGETVFGFRKPELKPVQGDECPHCGNTEFEN